MGPCTEIAAKRLEFIENTGKEPMELTINYSLAKRIAGHKSLSKEEVTKGGQFMGMQITVIEDILDFS